MGGRKLCQCSSEFNLGSGREGGREGGKLSYLHHAFLYWPTLVQCSNCI